MASSILVTGGAGFIGSHTVDLLISKGYDVAVLDNLSTGNRKNVNKKARFIFGDILNTEKISRKLKGIGSVIHCAAQISVTDSIKNPLNDANANVLGSLKLLEMCRSLKINKFVFASSCAVYGLNPRLPADEKDAQPENPYAVSKRSVEMYADVYRNYGIGCTSLRYANVYGPRQNFIGEAGVVAVFISSLLANERPSIFGDGKQTRDFVYVGDIAMANVKALTKSPKPKIINIGTGTQTSINRLFSISRKLTGKNIKPVYRKARQGEVRFSCLDISLAKKHLGWKPDTKLEDGIKRTIESFG